MSILKNNNQIIILEIRLHKRLNFLLREYRNTNSNTTIKQHIADIHFYPNINP